MKTNKWQITKLIDGNNEQAAIQWARHGIAALGEPSMVYRIEYYDSKGARDFAATTRTAPRFAK